MEKLREATFKNTKPTNQPNNREGIHHSINNNNKKENSHERYSEYVSIIIPSAFGICLINLAGSQFSEKELFQLTFALLDLG